MTAATLIRATAAQPTSKPLKSARKSLPPKPDKQLWKTDKVRAFEAGVQWFLAVSRAA